MASASARIHAFRTKAYPCDCQIGQFHKQSGGAEYDQAKLAKRETTMSKSDGDVERKLEKDRA